METTVGRGSSESYRPQAHVKEVLEWCLKRIQSVPYRVTARWLFYRLVQERGFTKKQYKSFLKWTSRARKRFHEGWAPDTLVDDTREAHERGFGYASKREWMEHFKGATCVLDKYASQQHIVEIWFEAEAMKSQFDYYTRKYYVTLRPFKGDTSIDYKWKIAKDLEHLAGYGKPIVVLYFGDYDEKGLKIPESALEDIKAWCKFSFRYVRCGINKEHIEKFGLIENPEKPGAYQWEALSEGAAEQLILGNLERFWSLDSINKVKEREGRAEERWREIIEKALEES